jgi:hypothetical protein
MISDTKLQPPYAVDGNVNTRYSTGQLQMGTEYFQVDLCRNVTVTGVILNDTIDTTDVALGYTVQTSLDGAHWTTMAMSAAAAPALLTVKFAATTARFVRFNQTGKAPPAPAGHWWSIDELNVTCN